MTNTPHSALMTMLGGVSLPLDVARRANNGGHRCGRPHRLSATAGMAALRAGETKNKEALVAANGQLVETCEGCHKQFKPALPSEGIMHTHTH